MKGPVTTTDEALMRSARPGYTFEPLVAAELKRRTLRVVLERYAPVVPGLFLYFASRAQVSPALRAFVDVAREWAAGGRSK